MGTSGRYLLCQFGGWGLHGAFWFAVTLWNTGQFSWGLLLAFVLAELAAGLYSHGIRAFIHKKGWLQLSVASALVRVFALSALSGVVLTPISMGFQVVVARSPIPDEYFAIAFFWQALSWSVTMALWASLYMGLKSYRRSRQNEITNLTLANEAKDARTRLLQSQLNPHFLFNSLNGIRTLIGEDPARAQLLVTELSDMLRHILRATEYDEVTFEHELQGIEAYLKLEELRLEHRLRYVVDADQMARRARIPPMAAFVLVENAVKHGVAPNPDGGEVGVKAFVAANQLIVEVMNPGSLSSGSDGNGLGLANVRRRLIATYGSQAELTLQDRDSGIVVAFLTIPQRPGVR